MLKRLLSHRVRHVMTFSQRAERKGGSWLELLKMRGHERTGTRPEKWEEEQRGSLPVDPPICILLLLAQDLGQLNC